ncbi:3279_t:CDS:10 [Acaulospora morrowiae]|uniref:tRNA-dihydrouridine(47) synthase [NAD(P)(+)] n=1 Tax=Acaulospora morrowiae TaxID=94023 RepID=A0A9N8W4B1_9GLOM|nr:3279_t:CDS:10 [Acaulospora morrowiae]
MNPSEDPPNRHGIAPVKKEYIIKKEEKGDPLEEIIDDVDELQESEEPPKKKIRTTRTRGSNKERAVKTFSEPKRLCLKVSLGEVCDSDSCKYYHDLDTYLKTKENDLGSRCINFEKYGRCRFGYRCRFLNAHLSHDGKLIVNEELASSKIFEEKNAINVELQKPLRKNKYKFPKSDVYLNEIGEEIAKQLEKEKNNKLRRLQAQYSNDERNSEADAEIKDYDHPEPKEKTIDDAGIVLGTTSSNHEGKGKVNIISTTDAGTTSETMDINEFVDTPDVPLRGCEKKKISFKNKLYLAPLTTVGNLPFRRICKEFGADITCGEMAMAVNLLQGQQSEWALVKRHVSEDIFGVQICGCKVQHLVKCAEVLNNEIEIDFVDINLGCPIDLVFNKGGGTALLKHDGRIGKIVRGMQKVMDIPVTVKLRTGIQDNIPVAHKLMPKFESWGIAMATLHGRSRQQRYTKLADWNYISEVSHTVKKMPVFGNGDVLGYTDYYEHLEKDQVDGIMIARGALIKPWIFDEIKSKRHYDISSKERFDILKKFCDYGMEHWGSDSIGVNQTRRFLCEWMSFLHRYIPVGLLEVLPQRINERPPSFRGRDELETLLASPNSHDWVKISEMLLGPAPDNFIFVPKHASNSYEG